jgi:hypothetical protein
MLTFLSDTVRNRFSIGPGNSSEIRDEKKKPESGQIIVHFTQYLF